MIWIPVVLGTLRRKFDILTTNSLGKAVVPKRCVAKLKKIFKLRLMMIINN
jgi:hypothetical protein